MVRSEGDFRFFGPDFQEAWQNPAARQMVKDVGALADELIHKYGVSGFEQLPPEGHDEFEQRLEQMNWSDAVSGGETNG